MRNSVRPISVLIATLAAVLAAPVMAADILVRTQAEYEQAAESSG